MEGRFGQEGQAMSPGGRQRFAAPIFLLLFAQVLFLAMPARALPGSWGPSTLLDALPGPSGDPQVAINPSGIAITVWTQESENGVYWNIFARRYVPGQGWEPAIILNTVPEGNGAYNPYVDVNALGNAMAVWWQWGNGVQNLYAARYVPALGWEPAELLKADVWVTSIEHETDVALDDLGNAILVWQERDGELWDVWGKRYESGIGWGPHAILTVNNSIGAGGARIAMNPSGNATVVWWQADLPDGRPSIWSISYSRGAGWGQPELIESENSHDAWWPVVDIDSHGNAVAVWHHYDPVAHDTSISANQYVAGGGWGTPVLVEHMGGEAYFAEVAMDHWGNAVAIWVQGDWDDGFSLLANRYVAGEGWGTPVLLENSGGDIVWIPRGPTVAVDAAGNAIALWSQWVGGWPDVLASRYEVGSGWGTPTVLESGLGSALYPAGDVSMEPSGNGIAVWNQIDDSAHNVYASVFDAGGDISWVSIRTPADGSSTGNLTVQIAGAAGQHPNGDPLDRVEVSCDGGSTWTTANGKDSWTHVCSLTNGSNQLYARSIDKQGRESLPDSVIVEFGTSPPSIEITSPTDRAWGSSPGITVRGTATDTGRGINRVEASCDDGTSWNMAAGTNSWTHLCTESNGIFPGQNRIRARAVDFMGFASSTEVIVNYDDAVPSVYILTPTNGAWVTTDTVLVQGTATDSGGSGVVEVIVSCNGGATWFPASGTALWSAECSLVPGGTQIRAKARALVGMEFTAALVVNYDTSEPMVAIVVPADGSVSGISAVVITGTATDLLGQVDRVEVRFDGADWNLAQGSESWTATGTLTPGWNEVHARAIDRVGRVSDPQSIRLFYDAAAPTITSCLAAPSRVVTLGETLLSATAVDDSPFGGVTYRLVVLKQGAVVASYDAPSALFRPGGVGMYSVQCVATDQVGHSSVATVVLFAESGSPPSSPPSGLLGGLAALAAILGILGAWRWLQRHARGGRGRTSGRR